MSSCTLPSSLGETTASWLATTVSALECVNSTSQVGTATTSHTSTNPSARRILDPTPGEPVESTATC